MSEYSKLSLSALTLILVSFFAHHLFSYKKEIYEIRAFANLPDSEIVAPELGEKNISLIFTGDIMLSRGVEEGIVKKNDWKFHFLNIADFLKNADLTFGNLEGPISNRGVKVGSIYSFRMNPKSVEGLLYGGFDVLSVANNHIWDYGKEAFEDTLKILNENDISYVGGGADFNEAHRPLVKEVKGTKIAFLAYTNLLPSFLLGKYSKPAVAFPDISQIDLDVKEAKKIADIVVVSFHFGEEYQTRHNNYQENLAHRSIDSGADLVIGHHPHVVQEIEKYKEGYIAYSLGNLIFDQNFSEDTRNGLIFKVFLSDKKIERVESFRIKFSSNFQPYLVEN